jgi:allantoinase
VPALDAKRAAATGQCFIDVGFWGGVVPGNCGDLPPLARAGVLGFKCFLAPSGVAEFEHVAERDVRAALPVLAELDRPLLVHAELPEALLPIDPLANPRAYSTWANSRPPSCEVAAIEMMIDAARQSGARVHIVHLATEEALPALKQARGEGVRITVETCPHYLVFAEDEIAEGDTRFKCAPPIRGRQSRDALWRALRSGDIDLVATDHSPAPPSLKRIEDGDFVQAWGGIASLQIGLAAVWTSAAERGGTVADLARWMSSAPASLAGLQRRKGAIAEGLDADIIVWDPEARWTVDAAALHHRHPVTPYGGRHLRGRVLRTFVRGHLVFDSGIVGPPRGELL